MLRNVEIKAKVESSEKLIEIAIKLSSTSPKVLLQEDTFFRAKNGRLKLRVTKDVEAQLIWYDRPDQQGPKLSKYHISSVADPEGMAAILKAGLGIEGVVKKMRIVMMIGQTRVHIDKVDGLGDFMELEVVLREGQSLEEGQQIAEDLMEKLGIDKKSLVEGAYHDLLQKK